MSENILEPKEITPEQVKSLLEKARDTEWRYLLKLREYVQRGGRYSDHMESKVVYGEASYLKIGHKEHGEEYVEDEYIIVPKTTPTIILLEEVYHVGDERHEKRIVYVFTWDGWKSIEAYSY